MFQTPTRAAWLCVRIGFDDVATVTVMAGRFGEGRRLLARDRQVPVRPLTQT
jgi:hypothetical protein